MTATLFGDAAVAGGCAMVAAAVAARWRWDAAWVPVAMLALAAAALAVLASVSGPATDDFTYAVAGRDGWLALQAALWNGWSGRFTANALLGGWPCVLPLHGGYPVMVLGCLAVAASGLAVLAWRLMPAGWTAEGRLAVVAWSGLGLLAGWPSVGEGMTWLAGAMTYTLPMGLAAWSLVALLAPSVGWWRLALALVLALLVAGSSEIVCAGLLAALGLGTGVLALGRDRRWRPWLAVLLAAGVAAALAAGAPGNQVRRAAVLEGRPPPDAAASAGLALEAGWWWLQRAWSSAGWTACLACIAVVGRRLGPTAAGRGWGWLAVGALVAAPLAAATLELPAIITTGVGLPPRGANVVWTQLWALLALAALAAGRWSAAWRWHQVAGVVAHATRRRPRLQLAAASLAVLAGLLLAAGWLELGPALAVLALVIAALALGWTCPGLPAAHRRNRAAACLAAVAAATACLGCVSDGSLAAVLADLPLVPGHALAADRRLSLIDAAGPGADVRLPMWDPVLTPRCAVPYASTGDRHDWANRAEASWHHLRSLVVVPP